jgi:hypothetical protein
LPTKQKKTQLLLQKANHGDSEANRD